MARQDGLIKLNGTLGGITFYKGQAKEGRTHLAKTKSGVDGDRIKNSPNFARTRENMSEFGRAAQDGKLIREAFAAQLRSVSDNTIVYRLVKQLRDVQDLDGVNARGARQVLAENIGAMTGFQFNQKTKLDAVFNFDIASVFASPNINFTVPVHVPVTAVRAPQGATHYKINVAGAAFNLVTGTVKANAEASSVEIPVGDVAEQAELPLAAGLAGAEAGDLMLGIVSVEFYQEVNGNFYLLANGAYTPMQVVTAGVFA